MERERREREREKGEKREGGEEREGGRRGREEEKGGNVIEMKKVCLLDNKIANFVIFS